MPTRYQSIAGCLIGMAVGDALGLPREGLSPKRAAKMFGDGPLRHRLLFGRGMVSDDTEHACLVGQALLKGGDDGNKFERALAEGLRKWLLTAPAGIGLATLKSAGKLLVGVPASRSGVNSAGNGPAMRAPLLGAAVADENNLAELLRRSTRMTHRHPLADEGAAIVAWAARHGAACNRPSDLLEAIAPKIETEPFRELHGKLLTAHRAGVQPSDFAKEIGQGRGVSGFIVPSVGAALYCWIAQPDSFEGAVTAAIKLGGDTDTVGAITGGIAGAAMGLDAIPVAWRRGLAEWPRTEAWMLELARRLADAPEDGPLPGRWAGYLLRSPLFTTTVLTHGLRRLLPPY